LLIIEQFESGLGDLKNLTAEPPDNTLGRQQIVALNTLSVG
jgi:hypothetical protein